MPSCKFRLAAKPVTIALMLAFLGCSSGLYAAEAAIKLDIPAQPLEPALKNLARQAGVQILFVPALTQGRTAPAVSGQFSAREALDRLLVGSGLTVRAEGDDVFTLAASPVAEDDLLVLPEVGVSDARSVESAYGPATGYVARRTASATKTDTPLIETPQTINIVTRDEMEVRNVQTVSQAVAYSSGVVTESYGPSPRDDYFFIRGFDAPQYLDSLRLKGSNYAQLRIDPYGLERVELLRGPSSVLYGQNAPGGLVNMISKLPDAEAYNEVELQYGRHDQWQGAVDLNAGLGENDDVRLRLVALARDGDTQVDHVGDRRHFIAPSLRWQIGEDTRLTLMTHFQKDDAGNTMQFLPVQGTLQNSVNGRLPTSRFIGEPGHDGYEREQSSLGYVLEHGFSEVLSFRQTLRFAHVDSDYRMVYSGDADGDGITFDGDRLMDRIAARWQDDADTFSLDNQLQAVFDTGSFNHKALMGLDYTHVDGTRKASDSLFMAAYPIDIYAPVYGRPLPDMLQWRDRDETQRQLGIYLQDQIALDRWRLTLSGRYDSADNKIVQHIDEFTLLPVRAHTIQRDHDFTGRFGLAYLFDNGIAPYVSFSTSFEPEIGLNANTGKPFEPTKGRQYELGVKYQPQGVNGFVTLSLFDLTQRNVVTADPVTFLERQTGEISVRGIELEGKFQLNGGLGLIASASWQSPEITGSDDPLERGNRPEAIPRTQAALWADYVVHGTGLTLGLGVRYQGSTYGDLGNALKVPSRTLWDAALHYDMAHLSAGLGGMYLSINAQNLADKEYVASCSGGEFCYWGSRRTVNAALGYRW